MFNDKTLYDYFPKKNLTKKFSNDTFQFRTCFKYQNSIRTGISNYKEEILNYTSSPECFCHLYSDFIDPSIGHVISGDLAIIHNKKLRKLFSKGLKFVEQLYSSKLDTYNSVKGDISRYVKGLSEKYSVNQKFFTPWKVQILSKLWDMLCTTKFSCKRKESLFVSEKHDMDVLKEHFVLTSVDKASNNISLICKKFYLDNLCNELSSTTTYEQVADPVEDIFKSHIDFCKKYNIPVVDKLIPFLHMLPKFHKNPIDYRYIAAGRKSSTKILSKILSSVFKLMLTQLKQYDNFKFKFKNTSGHWIVNNKEDTLFNLNFLNNLGSSRSIKSFDFKKLYTNLPHDKLVDKMSELIKLCFSEKKVNYINVSKKYTASWSCKGGGHWAFTEEDITEMFQFLINNIYVSFGDKIFRQVIGIPMGCDCAPQVADLFLFAYEHDFISKKVIDKDPIVHKLKYCGRYIDDLSVPNADAEVCHVICNDIYPIDLEIVDTNPTNSCTSTFLDVEISVNNKSFHTKLYDKRRDFSFNVITFPNLRSNVPHKQSYGIFVGELYRICKSSSNVEDFKLEVKLLIKKLINQKFNKSLLLKKLRSFLMCRPACLSKYWTNLSVDMFV